MNLDECNFIHSINACFTDGEPPADIPMREYMDLYFQVTEDIKLHIGVLPGTVKIDSVERVDWPDASLGNPRPGLSFAQVIVPGFRMTFEWAGATFTYHTSMDRVILVDE